MNIIVMMGPDQPDVSIIDELVENGKDLLW